MNDDWIKELKVGDEVIVIGGGLYPIQRIAKVEKINKTTIRVDGRFFHLDGTERGSSWFGSYLIPCTKEERERIMLEEEKMRLSMFLNRVCWDYKPIEVLRKVYKLITTKDE